MKAGLVSIITPCYNGAKYLEEPIESVRTQTYFNWEMIIIDDGSKDNSYEVATKYASEDERIKCFRQNNGGSASARNNGIRRAEGQYIALLDADDLWNHDFLSEQISFMKKHNTICIYSSYSKIDKQSNEILTPTRILPKSLFET